MSYAPIAVIDGYVLAEINTPDLAKQAAMLSRTAIDHYYLDLQSKPDQASFYLLTNPKGDCAAVIGIRSADGSWDTALQSDQRFHIYGFKNVNPFPEHGPMIEKIGREVFGLEMTEAIAYPYQLPKPAPVLMDCDPRM